MKRKDWKNPSDWGSNFIQIVKEEEIKLPLFTDHIIGCMETRKPIVPTSWEAEEGGRSQLSGLKRH